MLAQYVDFGPTLAAEKLRERHGLAVWVETLRRWMIEVEIWVPDLSGRVESTSRAIADRAWVG